MDERDYGFALMPSWMVSGDQQPLWLEEHEVDSGQVVQQQQLSKRKSPSYRQGPQEIPQPKRRVCCHNNQESENSSVFRNKEGCVVMLEYQTPLQEETESEEWTNEEYEALYLSCNCPTSLPNQAYDSLFLEEIVANDSVIVIEYAADHHAEHASPPCQEGFLCAGSSLANYTDNCDCLDTDQILSIEELEDLFAGTTTDAPALILPAAAPLDVNPKPIDSDEDESDCDCLDLDQILITEKLEDLLTDTTDVPVPILPAALPLEEIPKHIDFDEDASDCDCLDLDQILITGELEDLLTDTTDAPVLILPAAPSLDEIPKPIDSDEDASDCDCLDFGEILTLEELEMLWAGPDPDALALDPLTMMNVEPLHGFI